MMVQKLIEYVVSVPLGCAIRQIIDVYERFGKVCVGAVSEINQEISRDKA